MRGMEGYQAPARPKHTNTACLHALSVGHMLFARIAARAADTLWNRLFILAQLKRCEAVMAEQAMRIRILTRRMRRTAARKRPQYTPELRRMILEYQAAYGLTNAETARRFLIDPQTLAAWKKEGYGLAKTHLVEQNTPPNKYPEYVRQMVRKLKEYIPFIGKREMADMLGKCGLHLSASTVGRICREKPSKSPTEPDKTAAEPRKPEGEAVDNTEPEKPVREIKADYPNHVWNIDLTVVPIIFGLACTWMPFALPQCWPFAWYMLAVVDHYSRRCMGLAVFTRNPTSEEVRQAMKRIVEDTGTHPRYIICDRGKQFDCDGFRQWCKDAGIKKPRYGAIGKHHSIALTERMIKSIKYLWTNLIIVSSAREKFQKQLELFRTWYNSHRPHGSLAGRTPYEVYFDVKELEAMDGRKSPPKAPKGREAGCEAHAGQRSKRLPVVEIVEAA